MAANDILIFLSREKIEFASGETVIKFDLKENLVKDLEFVDKNLFQTELTNFLKENEIVSSSAIILLAESVCFISEEKNLEIFLESLPFENAYAREFEGKLIGTNKDLYQGLCDVVGNIGIKVKMVSPGFLFKETAGKKTLDKDMIRFVHFNEINFLNLTFAYDAPIIPSKPIFVAKNEKLATREKILIGVFTTLLVGFIIWLLTSLL